MVDLRVFYRIEDDRALVDAIGRKRGVSGTGFGSQPQRRRHRAPAEHCQT